jgi:sporulation protein YlmC with PRC-barrel domain
VAALSAEALLRLPVRLRGIDLGRAVDLILDPVGGRALGIDVLCKDDEHRFLPLSAAVIDGEEIAVSSALTLLAAGELAFYRKRASTMRLLRGAPVTSKGREVGRLQDVIVGRGGAIEQLVVEDGRRIPVGDDVRISAEPRRVDAA